MAGLAMVGGLVSGVASAAGGMMAAQGEAQALEAQANVKAAQAQAERRKGQEENAVQQREALQQEKKTRKVMSDQLAAFAHSGGGVGGSARVVRQETAEQGILNREHELWEGRQMEQARETQARILEMEMQALRQAAATKRKSAVISGVSGIAGSFGGIAKGGTAGPIGGNFFYG